MHLHDAEGAARCENRTLVRPPRGVVVGFSVAHYGGVPAARSVDLGVDRRLSRYALPACFAASHFALCAPALSRLVEDAARGTIAT